jgi:hypothetical protein
MKSKFDWHCEPLSPQTRITDSYKNTQRVRRFFKAQVGPHFHFDRDFMKWMKQSVGKTLRSAVTEWNERNGGSPLRRGDSENSKKREGKRR